MGPRSGIAAFIMATALLKLPLTNGGRDFVAAQDTSNSQPFAADIQVDLLKSQDAFDLSAVDISANDHSSSKELQQIQLQPPTVAKSTPPATLPPSIHLKIHSHSGIGGVKITRLQSGWPPKLFLQLDTKGLENFTIHRAGKPFLTIAVPSSLDPNASPMKEPFNIDWHDQPSHQPATQEVDKNVELDPKALPIRLTKLPLDQKEKDASHNSSGPLLSLASKQEGPGWLIELDTQPFQNDKTIEIRWIDFYR